MPLTLPPAVQSISSPGMSESAPIASSVMPARAREQTPTRIAGLIAAIGLLALGGAGAFWLLRRPPPLPDALPSSATVTIQETASAAPPIAPVDSAPAVGATAAAPVEITPSTAAVASSAPVRPRPVPSAARPPAPAKGTARDVGF
jgi:hypothetical protein